MRRKEFFRNISLDIDWSSMNFSSVEQLILNSTDASFIVSLDDTTDNIRLVKFQSVKTNKKTQREV